MQHNNYAHETDNQMSKKEERKNFTLKKTRRRSFGDF